MCKYPATDINPSSHTSRLVVDRGDPENEEEGGAVYEVLDHRGKYVCGCVSGWVSVFVGCEW